MFKLSFGETHAVDQVEITLLERVATAAKNYVEQEYLTNFAILREELTRLHNFKSEKNKLNTDYMLIAFGNKPGFLLKQKTLYLFFGILLLFSFGVGYLF